jgi:IclR family KDG regulon transcriptional repressor
MPNSTQTHNSVRAVDRALDILLCFSKAESGLSLSEIAREVNLHKSTVHRLLTSMQQKGFVRKHPQSDKYLLGWIVLELITNIYQSDELSVIVLPEMTRLRDITGETVSLYIRSGSERIRIQGVESTEPVRNVATIGQTYPLYIGASGKVLLAFAEGQVLEQVLRDDSIPPTFDVKVLELELQEVHRQGYAMSFQERDSAAAALAVPIFGRNDFLAALSVSGPVSRFTKDKMTHYLDTVRQSAALVTKHLSH